jgi:hypothetical protein
MSREVLLRVVFTGHVWLSARILPLLVGRQDMNGVRRYTASPERMPYAGLSADYIIGRVVRASRRPWLMRDRRCLREGLLGFRFLSLAGYRPELRFGVDVKSAGRPTIKAHCWVCLGDRAIIGDRLPDMVEILRIPAGIQGAAEA